MTTIKAVVEGGGIRREQQAKCRKAFQRFLGSVVPSRSLSIVAAGSRERAYKIFRLAMGGASSDEFTMLVVDSEEPVAGGNAPWTHLKTRDRWDKPKGASDDSGHLMVQCMEAWFLADKEALAKYYGSGFKANALPPNPNIEHIPKTDIDDGLKNATRGTTKRSYDKGRDSFAILGELDPKIVARASPYADCLLRVLQARASQ